MLCGHSHVQRLDADCIVTWAHSRPPSPLAFRLDGAVKSSPRCEVMINGRMRSLSATARLCQDDIRQAHDAALRPPCGRAEWGLLSNASSCQRPAEVMTDPAAPTLTGPAAAVVGESYKGCPVSLCPDPNLSHPLISPCHRIQHQTCDSPSSSLQFWASSSRIPFWPHQFAEKGRGRARALRDA